MDYYKGYSENLIANLIIIRFCDNNNSPQKNRKIVDFINNI